MAKMGIFTYNFVGGYSNGWQHQDDNWVFVSGTSDRMPAIMSKDAGEAARKNDFDYLARCQVIKVTFMRLQPHLEELDYLVVYLGVDGGENAIGHISNFPAEKLIFVMCKCNLDIKQSWIRIAGLDKTKTMICPCGGVELLGDLARHFLATGTLSLPKTTPA